MEEVQKSTNNRSSDERDEPRGIDNTGLSLYIAPTLTIQPRGFQQPTTAAIPQSSLINQNQALATGAQIWNQNPQFQKPSGLVASTNEEAQMNFKRLHQNTGSAISSDSLDLAMNSLKKSFSAASKKLFITKSLPTPFFRSHDSRPLHFSSCDSYLMYFSKSEFIKLDLRKNKTVLRRPLIRGDLSPIFLDYKIWSSDDSKVLVFRTREITASLGNPIFVYNTRTGQYKEITDDLRRKFRISSHDKKLILECFNPVNIHEIILRVVKKREVVVRGNNQRRGGFFGNRTRTTTDLTEDLVSWNYVIKSSRPFCSDIKPSGFSIIPLSQFIIVLNQEGSRGSRGNNRRYYWNNLQGGGNTGEIKITYFSVYLAKGYHKVLTMKKDQDENARNYSYDEYSIQSNPVYSLYAKTVEENRYKSTRSASNIGTSASSL